MKRLIPLVVACTLALAGTAQANGFPAGRALVGARALAHVATDAPAVCPAGVPIQTITVVNQANVRAKALARVQSAVTDESMQVRAAWGTPCVRWGAGGWVFTLTPGASVVNADGSTSTSIGGHHYFDAGVVSAVIQTGGTTYETWARAFSHEVIEALIDPTLGRWWKFGLVEVCDPVEEWTYPLAGVQVSDFVFPSYFSGGAGPWDQAALLSDSIANVV